MYNDLYCKVFIDTELSYEELFSRVLKYVDGKKVALTYISAAWCEISIQRNKEYSDERYLLDVDDFLYWKYYLDIEPLKIKDKAYIEKVSDLLKDLKMCCDGVIAACDFELELK